MRVIILAQGLNSRWQEYRGVKPPYEYKHLVEIGGQTILERVIEQVMNYGVAPIVIAPGEYTQYITYNVIPLRSPGTTLFHGLSATQPYWETGQTLFLLGDVIFSDAMMELIFTPNSFEKVLYGREGGNPGSGKTVGEIFALKIKQSYYNQFFAFLRQRLNRDEGGRLWDLHKLGYPFVQLRGDWTDDIDSPQEYDEFFGLLEECVLDETNGI